MNSPRLWIALTRPDNLVTALAAAVAAREDFSGCVLVYERSSWWEKAAWDEYRDLFDEIHTIPKVPTCRGLRDLGRFARALAERQRRLEGLPVAPGDTLLLLAGITTLSNALVSAHPRARSVLCVPVKKYLDASGPVSFRRYRHTTSGWWQNHFLEPRAGLRRTLHLKPWWGGGDGVRIKRLQEPLEAVFDAILLLSNGGQERPQGAGGNVWSAKFPALHELRGVLPTARKGAATKPKVVFFGTPFLLVRNLAPEVYAERLNACLEHLRCTYAPRCELVYRPHPAETRESTRLRLDGYAVEADGQVAELYFLRHSRRLEAVFSVSSTVSRVALNYGLNGYALWRCFPFDAPATAYFESLMGQVPPEFDVRSLAEPPVAYADGQRAAANGPEFTAAFTELAVQSSPAVPPQSTAALP